MTYFQYFWRKKLTIALAIAGVLVLALLYTLTQPFEYRSTAQLIVVHENEQLDSYTASRAAERSAKTLSNVIGTTSFFESVLASDPEIVDVFGASELERRRNWNKSISVTVIPDTGVLALSAYSESPTQAERIALAASTTLSTQQWKYLGAGTSAVVELIDAPLTSSRPVRPNIVVNVIAGILAGLLVGVTFVVLRDPSLSSGTPMPLPSKPMPQPSQPDSTPNEAPKLLESPWSLPKKIKEVKPKEPETFQAAVPNLPFEEMYAEAKPSMQDSVQDLEVENRVVVDGQKDAGLGMDRSQLFTMHDHLKRLQEQASKK